MFCPNCNTYLQEKNLLKTNVKKWGNTDIEYDARCAACGEEIGRMSWGKLNVKPELLEKQAAHLAAGAKATAEAGANQPQAQPDSPAGTPDSQGGTDSKPLFVPLSVQKISQSSTHPYCPHCGGQLPDNPAQLPRH